MQDFKTLDFINDTFNHWSFSILHYIPNIVVSIFVIIISKIISSFLIRFIKHLFRKKEFSKYLMFQKFFSISILGLFWTFIILLILNILNLTGFVTHILAGAGILGVIGGLSLKDIASNAFAGFLLKVQRPFSMNDWVNINGYLGTIQYQGLIMTGIKTIEGQMAYIPNQVIFNNSYLNYSKFGTARVIVNVGVSYGDDLDKVEKLTLEAIKNLPMVINPETADFYFINIGSSTYNFEARFWIKFNQHTDFLYARSVAIKELKTLYEKEDICVAYNVMTLDFGVKGGVNLYDKNIKIDVNSQNK